MDKTRMAIAFAFFILIEVLFFNIINTELIGGFHAKEISFAPPSLNVCLSLSPSILICSYEMSFLSNLEPSSLAV